MTDSFSDIVEDRLLGERLKLLQPRHGHRAGTDALLLAAATPAGFSGHIADLGAGVGTVGLTSALLAPAAQVTLVERDPGAAGLANRNIMLNELESRVGLAAIDLFSGGARREAGLRETVDLVLTNPPFHDAGAIRHSPNAAKRSAHVLEGGNLDDWMRACADVTRPGGHIVVIHRADAVQELLVSFDGRFGGVTVRPVHAYKDAPALRVLIAGRKGSRAPLHLMPPIILHERGGSFTDEVAAINKGEARISISL
ncbi:tRNA1(Val) (adenine(37)-N6)-methyltransferase [Pseudochelatococcus sp. G4_1912]|uniref:tRNA1(Val) (adenine(37)-N6)-methyltransferase n=1 Tax=Pseudochelatococcus sp. G4_1912 TaxID=3114288 RepID=UPI0039C67B4B